MKLSYNITQPYKQFSKTFWKNLFYTSFITIVLTSLRTGMLYSSTTHSDKKEVLGTKEPIAEQQEEIVEEEYDTEDWSEYEQYEQDILFFCGYIMMNIEVIDKSFYEIEQDPLSNLPWQMIEDTVSECKFSEYWGDIELVPEDLLPKIERIRNLTENFCTTLAFTVELREGIKDETDADILIEGYSEIQKRNGDAYDTSELMDIYMYELIDLIEDEKGEDI